MLSKHLSLEKQGVEKIKWNHTFTLVSSISNLWQRIRNKNIVCRAIKMVLLLFIQRNIFKGIKVIVRS